MGDRLISMLKHFLNPKNFELTEYSDEQIKSSRYDLHVTYFRGAGTISGSMGTEKVLIHFNACHDPEHFVFLVNGKRVSGNIGIDVIDTFSRTGQLIGGVRIVRNCDEIVADVLENNNVSKDRRECDEYVLLVYPERVVDKSAIVLYCVDKETALAAYELFNREGYWVEQYPLSSSVVSFFLKHFM
jgi:hypothetical protein